MSTLLFLIASLAAAPTGADRIRDQALEAYLAKDYETACPLFRRVALRRVDSGAAWADLGLCELRRGRTDAAVEANVRAVRFGDEAIRLNAYHNLWKAGVSLAPARAKGARACTGPVPVHPALACPRTAYGQVARVADGGAGMSISVSGWNAVLAPDAACDEAIDEVHFPRSASAWISTRACAAPMHADPKYNDLDVARGYRFTRECLARGEVSEIDCLDAATAAMSVLAGGEARARKPALLRKARRSIAAEAKRNRASCLRGVAIEQQESSGQACVVVSVDPCSNRVGLVCNSAWLRGGPWSPLSPAPGFEAVEWPWLE